MVGKNNTNNDNIEKKERQLDNLIDIVENHTRTERHLEQYSHIGNPYYKEQARIKQDVREEQANNLKHQLMGDENDAPSKEEQLEDLKKNYEYGENYIESNKKHMNSEMLQNLERKQENRKTQIQNLEDNF